MMEERAKRPDQKFCHECGDIIRAKAEICPKCGCRQPGDLNYQSSGVDPAFSRVAPKSRTTAAVLAIFLGGVGAHKFYLGKPIYGIAYALFVLTFIPAFIGLIEGIRYIVMSDDEFQNLYATDKLDLIGGKSSVIGPDTHVKCPDCRALIPKDARICRSCGCQLVPQM
jgi:TM2 domain-containing membrane protein YozV/RNA polymerase subunit RPABC4/transcription elongation factor Spt4